jgi:hypothetical protein
LSVLQAKITKNDCVKQERATKRQQEVTAQAEQKSLDAVNGKACDLVICI